VIERVRLDDRDPDRFSKIVTLVREAENTRRKVDKFHWRIGDALVAECGPPGRKGANTGTKKRLNKITAELKRAGFGHWTLAVLRKLRTVASAFPDATRIASVSISVHQTAGNPTTLIAIMEAAGDQCLTVALAKKLKKRIELSCSTINTDAADVAILESRFTKTLSDIARLIDALQRKIDQIEPERAHDLAKRCMKVAARAQEIAALLRGEQRFEVAA
jgi:hypothetical protein